LYQLSEVLGLTHEGKNGSNGCQQSIEIRAPHFVKSKLLTKEQQATLRFKDIVENRVWEEYRAVQLQDTTLKFGAGKINNSVGRCGYVLFIFSV